MGAAAAVARRIRRSGPIPFSAYLAIVLDDPEVGFFGRGRGAGRAGRDFVTSPETGSLFGALVARALDGWWSRLGRPDPFLVVEAGAGDGRLAREVLRAAPACAPALRYLLVERSPALRAAQAEVLTLEPADELLGPAAAGVGDDAPEPVPGTGPICAALGELPAHPFDGVVLANELLDNLAFDLAERRPDGGWDEVRVGLGDGPDDGPLVEVTVPLAAGPGAALDAILAAGGVDPGTVGAGARLPVPVGIEAWLADVGRTLRRGAVLLVDYAVPVADALARSPGWLRTYRSHSRGDDPLVAPGDQDVTADVVLEQLDRAARRARLTVAAVESQADWLRGLGLDDLVAAGARAWSEGAHRGDLAALAGRSRATEAAALTDPTGLGAHTVVTLTPTPPHDMRR